MFYLLATVECNYELKKKTDSRRALSANLYLCSTHSSERAVVLDKLVQSWDPSRHREHALAPSRKEKKKGGKRTGMGEVV